MTFSVAPNCVCSRHFFDNGCRQGSLDETVDTNVGGEKDSGFRCNRH